MEATFVILYARPYSFEGEKDKQTHEGTQLVCLDGVTLWEDDSRGCVPMTYNASKEVFNELPELPGVYKVEIGMRPYKGKPMAFLHKVLKCLGRAKIGLEQSGQGAQS